MMKFFTKSLLLIAFIFFATTQINAQCTYTLTLEDNFGDGWDFGSFLSVDINGTSTEYILDDSIEIIELLVNEGDAISIFFTPAFFSDFEASYSLQNSENITLFSDGPNLSDLSMFETIVDCPTCFIIDQESIVVDINSNTVNASWSPGTESQGYLIEYGPQGFPLGSGETLTVTDAMFSLENLIQGCGFDFYISNICSDDDISNAVGPNNIFIPLDPGLTTCTYTFNLHDSYGDGWNGSILTITVDGVSTFHTIDTGFEETFEFEYTANQTVVLSYSGGNYESEVTYDIVDSDGNIIFMDGNFPQIDNGVYCFIACSDCQTPTSTVTNISFDRFDINWEEQDVSIEYGTEWFLPGTGQIMDISGSSATISGLNENTIYHFYITGNCGDEKGCKIGPISVMTGIRKDVGISAINTVYTVCDLNTSGEISIDIFGYGSEAQSLIPVYYSVDGVPANIPMPQDGFFTGVVGFEGTEDFIFETMFSVSTLGTHTLTAWTELPGDSNTSNDTLTIEFEIVGQYLPLAVNFDIPMIDYIDDGWSFSNGFFTPDHNNESNVWASNLYFSGAQAILETPAYGIVNEGDFFTFDYRYTVWSAGIDPITLVEDSLNVYISADCGETWDFVYSVNAENHTPSATMTNISVDMADYVGQFVQIRVHGVYGGGGDYWLDVDNLNILSCGPDLGLEAEVTSVTDDELGTILIVPQYGAGPFEYLYSDGNTDNPRTDVDINSYEVTVTDAIGCSSIIVVDVNHISATPELENDVNITLSPNPVKEVLTIDLTFKVQKSFSISIYNQLGQLVNTIERERTLSDIVEINMTSYSEGLYYILLQGENLVHSEKVMVSK